jgi:hypothetical protein
MKLNFSKQLTDGLVAGLFVLLAFTPLASFALQVDISADEGVPDMTVREVQAGVAKVENFYQDYYGLDIDYPIKLILVSSKEKYITTIMEEFGDSRELIEKYYYNTGGLTSGHTIISNMAACPYSGMRMMNIAHELTHQYELSLGGASAHRLRWMSEGTADIMAMSILSLNGMASLNKYDKTCMQALQAVPAVPNLSMLRGAGDWMDAANTTGQGVNYRMSDCHYVSRSF